MMYQMAFTVSRNGPILTMLQEMIICFKDEALKDMRLATTCSQIAALLAGNRRSIRLFNLWEAPSGRRKARCFLIFKWLGP